MMPIAVVLQCAAKPRLLSAILPLTSNNSNFYFNSFPPTSLFEVALDADGNFLKGNIFAARFYRLLCQMHQPKAAGYLHVHFPLRDHVEPLRSVPFPENKVVERKSPFNGDLGKFSQFVLIKTGENGRMLENLSLIR
jgi:hypothetical protein